MKIAVTGTGPAGRTVAAALARLGHEVAVGTRDPHSTLERRKPGALGVPPFASRHAGHRGTGLAGYAAAAGPAGMIVDLASGRGSVEALKIAR